MAKYKPQVKNSDGTLTDLDLCAKYDNNGNQIDTTYVSNSDLSVSSSGVTYDGTSYKPIIILEDNGTTTTGTWLAKATPTLTSYVDGQMFLYKIIVAGHSSGVTMNIDGLGAKSIYRSNTSVLTTHFGVGQYILFTYNSTNTCFRITNFYDSDTYPAAVCSTAAATQKKTASHSYHYISANSYSLITIRYTNTYAGLITLNVNSQGAKNVYINGTISSSSNYNLVRGTYIFYYDGTNYYFRTDGYIPRGVDRLATISEVPTTASEVGALADTTKYGANITLSLDSTNYKITAILKDQDGNTLATSNEIDLPIESVVVNGSYDNTTKKITLTLQSGSTLSFSVAELVSGLQSEITSSNKLSISLISFSGTSSQFLKGDGSLDSNSYITNSVSNLTNYYTKTESDNLLADKLDSGDLSVIDGAISCDENSIDLESNSHITITSANDILLYGSSLKFEGNEVATQDWVEVKGYSTFSGSYNDLTNKPTYSASASAVSGANTAKSLNLNGTYWNLPEGSSGGGTQLYLHTITGATNTIYIISTYATAVTSWSLIMQKLMGNDSFICGSYGGNTANKIIGYKSTYNTLYYVSLSGTFSNVQLYTFTFGSDTVTSL